VAALNVIVIAHMISEAVILLLIFVVMAAFSLVSNVTRAYLVA
jgi:hypothetical protein